MMADLWMHWWWWDVMVGGLQLCLVGRYSSFGHLSSLQSLTVLIFSNAFATVAGY
jgi:hypothetical protein